MHHPEIHDILIALEDFLLLSGCQHACEISPIRYLSETAPTHSVGDIKVKGIRIRQQLSNGWMDIVVWASDKDSNTVNFDYLTSLNPREKVEAIKIASLDFSFERSKDAIRHIILLDRKETKELAYSLQDTI